MNKDIYDNKINSLLNYIREFGNKVVYYAKIKNELKEFKKSNLNYGKFIENEKLIELIVPFNDLLNHDVKVQRAFLQSPNLNHEIFQESANHIETVNLKFDQILAKMDGISDLDEMENEFKLTSMKRLDTLNQYYVDSYNSFRQELIDYANNRLDDQELTEKDFQIFNRKPIYVGENLEFYQIDSLELANRMVFYDELELSYKKSIAGSIGGKFENKMYIKVDNGLDLLAPSHENAILQFYRILFPETTSTTLITPSKIFFINDFKTVDIKSNIGMEFKQIKQQFRVYSIQDIIDREPVFQKYESYKEDYGNNSIEQILKRDSEFKKLYEQYKEGLVDELFTLRPDLKSNYEHSLLNYRNIFLQASLLVNGISLQDYLETHQKENKAMVFEDINIESYSAHIISSLLVIPNDYKPSNLIIEESTNGIIGIDNGNSLNSNEVEIYGDNKLVYLKSINVLYTLRDLMMRSINENVRNQIINLNPCKFVLDWLLSIISKNSDYESLVELPFNLTPIKKDETSAASLDKKELKRKLLNNIKRDLKIPLMFNKGWITSMLNRLKKIKQLLLNDNSISHQELFEQVHPLASIYYNVLEEIYDGSPLDQMKSIYYDKLDLISLIKQSPLNEKDKSDLEIKVKNIIDNSSPSSSIYSINSNNSGSQITIEDSIKEIIENTEYSDFNNNLELIDWLKLVISLFNQMNEDTIKLHSSINNQKINILLLLFKNSASVDLIDNYIKVFDINKQDFINSNVPILNNIINSKESNILEQVEYLLNKFQLDTEVVEDGLTLLDISTKYKDLDLFKLLLDKGAGKKSNSEMIYSFYQILSNHQKLELKPYLKKLFQINPEANWVISLNQLIPIKKSQDDSNNNVLLENGENRIIISKYLDALIDYSNGGDKSNKDMVIEDEYGNALCFKVGYNSINNELAISSLSRLLFGDDEAIKPYSTLATFNNKPILIYQQILGERLDELFKKDKDIINQIEPISLSKQIIISTILNNNYNLNNFILIPINSNSSTNNSSNSSSNSIASIKVSNESAVSTTVNNNSKLGGYMNFNFNIKESDNSNGNNSSGSEIHVKNQLTSGNSFGGSMKFNFNEIEKEKEDNQFDDIEGFSFVVLNNNKNNNNNNGSNKERTYKYKIYSINNRNDNQSISTSTVCSILFFFNQMNNIVNQLVLKQIKKMNIQTILDKWINQIKSMVINNSNNENQLFNKDSIKQIFSKLNSLQNIAIKDKTITYLEILNVLEPEVATKVKQISDHSKNLTIQQKYSKFKQILNDNQQFKHLGDSINIQSLLSNNSNNTSTSSLVSASTSTSTLDSLLKQIKDISKETNEANELLDNISKYSEKEIKHLVLQDENELQDVLKQTKVISDYDELKIFELIKKSKIKCLYLRNSNLIKKRILKQFKLDILVKIDLSGSQLTSLKDVLGSSMSFKSLVSLKINDCKKMKTIDIVAPELKEFSATYNPSLTSFYLKAPNLTSLNMNNSVNNGPIYTFISQNHFQNLEYLNISGYQGYDEMIVNFKKLKVLDCSYVASVKVILFNVPLIESINLDGCNSLREIRSIFGNDKEGDHKNLWIVLNQLNNRKFINLNSIKTYSIVNNEYRQVSKIKPYNSNEEEEKDNNN